jgi:hypothetical protein
MFVGPNVYGLLMLLEIQRLQRDHVDEGGFTAHIK